MNKVYNEIIEYCASKQRRCDRPGWVTQTKIDAKKRAAELLNIQEGWKILDIGGENFYLEFFPGMEQMNLPEDMHYMEFEEEFDAVTAMHVLEHSPFPMLVLRKIYYALRPKGTLYVAVPHPHYFFDKGTGAHFTVLSTLGWEKLITGTEFEILHQETGAFGEYSFAIEERYLCRKR